MSDSTAATISDFEKYRSLLAEIFANVEDDTFSWSDVIGLLIIQLKNTDSLNKASSKSHATQIQITSEKDPSVVRSTEDFFPTLTLNSSFKGWRMAIPTRIHMNNISMLRDMACSEGAIWFADTLQMRRRLLNDDGTGYGNPNLQICYGNDLMPLRELLTVGDYLVFVKRRGQSVYEVLGVRGNVDLGTGKKMHLSHLANSDSTVFHLGNIIGSSTFSFNTGYQSGFARNRIIFGAPGTGKSFTVNKEKNELLAGGGAYERVTFHPDYTYANFVGTYKPVPCKDNNGNDAITYEYVPGPFMRLYAKALQNSMSYDPQPHLLVIEEINRANVAAVFGDVFQLLDRGDDEVSEYPIQASEDIKKYLARELGGKPDDYSEIQIPDNMFIWATMNSADQGVFPMDTAFKRRWDFTYLGIDDSEDGIQGKKVVLGQGEYQRTVEWNALRRAINTELLSYKVNEDKLMGPYFIAKKNLPEGEMFDTASFVRIFKNKVIMYLFDDAAKQKRATLFGGCDEKNQYSKICKEFEKKGVFIFCDAISSQFVPGDDSE